MRAPPPSRRADHERTRGRAVLALAYGAALAAALLTVAALRGRHPVVASAAADLAATGVVFGASVLAGNSSVYDPYWSVAPLPIALHWAWISGGLASPRAAWVLLAVGVWGVRLTANQLARWRGLGDEDFRYVELRARAGRLYWPLSLVGIHLLPTLWVFLALLPLWRALSPAGPPLGPLDAAACLVTAGALALEATADAQLRAFLRARTDPVEVLTSGVWAWSRHPNYLGEVLFWWGLWLTGAVAGGWGWAAVTAAGPVAITLLFLFVSIPWMDRRMAARHPAQAARLRTLPALVPWPAPRA